MVSDDILAGISYALTISPTCRNPCWSHLQRRCCFIALQALISSELQDARASNRLEEFLVDVRAKLVKMRRIVSDFGIVEDLYCGYLFAARCVLP